MIAMEAEQNVFMRFKHIQELQSLLTHTNTHARPHSLTHACTHAHTHIYVHPTPLKLYFWTITHFLQYYDRQVVRKNRDKNVSQNC